MKSSCTGSMLYRHISEVFLCFALSLPLLFQHPVRAGEADGSARITLTGKLAPGVPQKISIREIESPGIVDVEFYSPYLKRTMRCSGIWLEQFVSRFAAPGVKRVTMTAIDNYSITFSPDDWQHFKILLVTRKEGQFIGFSEQGPLLIAYPEFTDNNSKYQKSLPKWIWMISKVTFE